MADVSSSDDSYDSDLLERSLAGGDGWRVEDELDKEAFPLDIYTACSIGHHERVSAIIESKNQKEFDAKNKGGWTPLMYASYIGHDSIVSLLIKAGVSVNARNNHRQTPLMLAASCGNESVAYLLLEAGAELESRDKKGWTALFHATYSGHQDMVKFLLTNKANPEARENSRELTPFMEAAAAGHEIIVQCFLQHGIDVDVRTSQGDNARSLALVNGHTKIVSLIDNHLLGPNHPLRSEPGLDKEDECYNPWNTTPKNGTIGPNLRDGPEDLNRLLDKRKPIKAPNDIPNSTEEPVVSNYDTLPFTQTGALSIKNSADTAQGLHSSFNQPSLNIVGGPQSSSSPKGWSATEEWGQPGLGPWADKSPTGSPSPPHHSPSPPSIPAVPDVYVPFTDSSRHQFGTFPHATVPSSNKTAKISTADMFPNYPRETDGRESTSSHKTFPSQYERERISQGKPADLADLLKQLNLSKYLSVFDEQDVDLGLFLSLTDDDLKEVGIDKFGPRRKMMNAIDRWHKEMQFATSDLEQGYTDQLLNKLQENDVKFHQIQEQFEECHRQLQQEQQLRAVAERALLEERHHWRQVHRLSLDTKQRCLQISECLLSIRQCQSQVSRLMGVEAQLSSSGHYSHLVDTFSNQLQLGDSHTLLGQQWRLYEDMSRHLAAIVDNIQRLQPPSQQTSSTSSPVH